MQSQRDGYNHLYLYSKDGQLIRQLTSGPWVAMDVLGFNDKQKSIIIEANAAGPLERRIYSVGIAKKQFTALDKQTGSHHGTASTTARHACGR